VDATYMTDLREMNELNYARFEAKLEQRLAELRAELRAELGAEIRLSIADLESRLGARLERMESAMREHGRFLYLAWAAQLAAIIGLWFR
jgi:hypothetical protein